MSVPRWSHCFDSGAVDLPSGPCCVLGARGDGEYGAFGDVSLQTDWATDTDGLRARGHRVVQDVPGPATMAAVLVQIVKSKPRSLAMIAAGYRALRPGGLLMIDGQKTEGIESILKALKTQASEIGVMSKAHGKLLWTTKTAPDDHLALWAPQEQDVTGSYVTRPGVFSADGPDRGSELLVALLPELAGRGADFGAGWGYLSGEVLKEHPGISALDLIEADALALSCAERNVTDPRARPIWADVTAHVPDAAYDFILSNPPFHSGRAADPGLGISFIQAAAAALVPKGRFFMVANRHLPYERALKEAFATGRLLGELEGFKLYEASKPKRGTSPR